MIPYVSRRSFLPASLCSGFFFGGLAAPLAADPPKAATPVKVRETLNLRYHNGKDRQVLDVIAAEGIANAPVVIFIHGGVWMFGDKDLFGLYRGVGQFLARQGYVAVLVNYRLSPTVQHPEHIKDIARAYAWVRRNIRKHGGDPDQMFLAGHSAGGHLAALLGTDPTYWKDPALGLKPDDRASLRGVVGISGVYRIPTSNEATAMMSEMLYGVQTGASAPLFGANSGKPRPRRDFLLFKVVFGDDAKVRAAASPVNHVQKSLPPFLLLFAERELPTLPEMARDFARRLRAAGNTAEEARIPGCHHNTILFNLAVPNDPTAKALLEFLNRHALRPASGQASQR